MNVDDGDAEREALRATFETAAATYHRARPATPNAVFDAIADYADVPGVPRVLEIGPATGVATVPMAERGWRVTAVELGADLADEARRNTAGFGCVEIVTASFDTWEPPAWGSFDLVVAATAWHWLDPATRSRLAARHLRPGGVVAHWAATHVLPTDGDPFFVDIQDVYDEIGESKGDEPWIRPGEVPDRADELAASGDFGDIRVVQFDWETVYDADGYIGLLDTFSGHLAMGPERRERLYGEIRRRLAERPDGRLRRHWGAALHLARRI